MSDIGIDVYFPDLSHGEEVESKRFKQELEAEYGVPFRFVSIGRGAAAAAYVAELISFAQSPEGIASGVVALFFAGEKIEKNIDAFLRMYSRLRSAFHRNPTFDREGAAVLVQKAIADRLSAPPKSTRCEGFEIIDRLSLGNPMKIPAPMPVTMIGPPADKVTNSAVYYFQVQADDRIFLARVDGHNVDLVEVNSPHSN